MGQGSGRVDVARCCEPAWVLVRAVALTTGLLFGSSVAEAAQNSPEPLPAPSSAPASSLPIPASPDQLLQKSVKDLSHGSIGAVVHDDVTALRRGPLLIHGNYCGIGNRPGMPPIDALDAACQRHDACTKTGKLPSCRCDERLRDEARAIATNPQTAPRLQILASATASAMAVLICH